VGQALGSPKINFSAISTIFIKIGSRWARNSKLGDVKLGMCGSDAIRFAPSRTKRHPINHTAAG